MTCLLEVRHLSKCFGGVHALTDISLTIPINTIYGLIGPNGAGKTTFFNVLTGTYTPDNGTLLFSGKLLPRQPHQIVAQGIARTFQNIRLFRELTVLENVMVGGHIHSRASLWDILIQNHRAKLDEQHLMTRAMALLEFVGLTAQLTVRAKNLAYGDQRRLEIARALATEPRLLALDEPAAGMNATETAQLRELVRAIRAQGITVLLIEHDVKLVMSLCDRIAVFDFGRCIAEGDPHTVQHNTAVIEAYLGAGHVA